MQYNLNKAQLIGLKKNIKPNDRSLLNLFKGDEAPVTFNNPQINTILALPEYVSALTLVNDYTFYDVKLSYRQDKCLSLTASGDGYLLEDQVDFDAIFAGLEMYMGNSILMNSDFDVTLPMDESLTLLQIFDLYRAKKNLLAPEAFIFTEQELKTFAAKDNSKVQKISAYAEMLTGKSTLMPLDLLVEKGLLEKRISGYELSSTPLSFVSAFNTIDNYINVEAFSTVTTGFTALQSGILTTLYIEVKDNQLVLRAVSPKIIQELAETLIRKNEKLMSAKSASNEPQRPELTSAEKFCTNCGAAINTDVKFCGQCGEKTKF